VNTPGLQDAERELARARRELDMAAAAAGDAERHGRLVQASQALGNAARIVSGLAGAIAPAEPAPGPVINFGAIRQRSAQGRDERRGRGVKASRAGSRPVPRAKAGTTLRQPAPRPPFSRGQSA
jgi:hypothetical protein